MDSKDQEIQKLNDTLVNQERIRQELQLQLDSINKNNFDVDSVIKDLNAKLCEANKRILDAEILAIDKESLENQRKIFYSDVLGMVCDAITNYSDYDYIDDAIVRIIKGVSLDILPNN